MVEKQGTDIEHLPHTGVNAHALPSYLLAGCMALCDFGESPESKTPRGTGIQCDPGRVHGAVHQSCAEIERAEGRWRGVKNDLLQHVKCLEKVPGTENVPR